MNSSVQDAICEFIRDYMEEHSYPPTISEVGEHMNRSTAWAYHTLNKMEERGLITRGRGHARTVAVVE